MAGVVDGQNVQDTALAAAENLMTANPDLTAIYATGEPALLGAVAAVESQGKQAEVKMFGWDLTASADQGHRRGLCRGRHPAGPGRHGCRGGRCAEDDHRRRHGRADHLGAGHHRDQGECRRLPAMFK